MESTVPEAAQEGTPDHFFENVTALNEQMACRPEAAREMGMVLRYVARFDANGKARVGVEAVRPDHPLAALQRGIISLLWKAAGTAIIRW